MNGKQLYPFSMKPYFVMNAQNVMHKFAINAEKKKTLAKKFEGSYNDNVRQREVRISGECYNR